MWGYDSDAEDNNVEVYISFLRRKLEHLHSAVKIRTHRMVGYCLEVGGMSGMIRRLRWKIVGISMLFVTLVLAAVFTGVMLTARSSLEQSSTRQLEEALRGEGYDGQNGQPCFVTEVYSSGTVRVMGSSYYQISEEACWRWCRNACPGRRRAAC